MRRAVRFALFGLIAIGVAACARSGPPAPVFTGSASHVSPAANAGKSNAPIAPGSIYSVRSGDTLYTIARRSGVPTRAIIDSNRLSPPYTLEVGTRLSIPAVQTYEVKSGDTVSQIALRFGVPMRELVRANAIEPPYVIRIGQRLVLPESGPPPSVVAVNQPPARLPSAPRSTVEAAPLPPPAATSTHVSKPPDAAPGLATQVPLPAVAEPPKQEASVPVAPSNPAATPPSSDTPQRSGDGRMQWPVRGVIVSEFGPKAGGLQNDGINIAAPRGTAFRAADNGVVIYAGNELRGFGNLLLIRHESGVVSAYAHADELAVQRGDQVRRGQTIGRVGSTGNVTSPQLHFEVRKGTRAVNPMDFLGAQTSAAN